MKIKLPDYNKEKQNKPYKNCAQKNARNYLRNNNIKIPQINIYD